MNKMSSTKNEKFLRANNENIQDTIFLFVCTRNR